MKITRHNKILEVVQNEVIVTQEQLAESLRKVGIEATQATISRDIKELRLQKALTSDGQYRYYVPGQASETEIDNRLITIFRESVVSVEAAQNIVVIKTFPALASGACSAVDGMQLDTVVGSLAGDDTVILIMKSEKAAKEFCLRAAELIK